MTPTLTPLAIARNIAQAREGYGWCGGCGNALIAPDERGWKRLCSLCFAEDRQVLHCIDCGDPLDTGRVAHARRRKGVCLRCVHCSNRWSVKLCPDCGVKHPTSYHPTFAGPAVSSIACPKCGAGRRWDDERWLCLHCDVSRIGD